MSTPGTIVHVEQGSLEWKEVRCGIVTASRCGDLWSFIEKGKNKGADKAERTRYREELICEVLTGVPYPHFESADMRWGKEQEPFARTAYETQNDVLVETVGFVMNPTEPRFGCSPDGLVGDDGMIQIKCPTMITHLNWMRAGVIPIEHAPQMLAELACTGREWIDFVSFHPNFPEHLQLFVRRWERHENMIVECNNAVRYFNREIDQVIAALPQKPQGVLIAMDQVNSDEVVF